MSDNHQMSVDHVETTEFTINAERPADADITGAGYEAPDVKNVPSGFADLRHKAVEAGEKGGQPAAGLPIVEGEEAGEGGGEEGGETAAKAADPDREIKKPWARLRILEKERNSAQQEAVRVPELERRLEVMGEALERLAAQGAQPANPDAKPGDKAVDPELDPVGAILQEVRSVKQELATLKQTQAVKEDVDVAASAIEAVNHRLISQLQEDPVLAEAMTHIGKTIERTTSLKYPKATEAQKLRLFEDAINRTKLGWYEANRDPVEAMYEMAMALNFDPDAAEARLAAQKSAPAPGQPKTAKSAPSASAGQSAKAQVAKSREREAATTGLGGTQGAPPAKSIGRELATADPEEFNHIVNKYIEQGLMRPASGSIGRTPSFSELLPGKGRRIG